MQKIYKGVSITLDDKDGKFFALINGVAKRFPSLKSAMNAIDKFAIVDFKPVEVLIVDEEGYSPCKYIVKKVKLIGYYEDKSYRSSYLRRFFKVEKGDSIQIDRRTEVYPLTAFEKLTTLCKERTEQEKIAHIAELRSAKLGEQIERIEALDLDPRPELAD